MEDAECCFVDGIVQHKFARNTANDEKLPCWCGDTWGSTQDDIFFTVGLAGEDHPIYAGRYEQEPGVKYMEGWAWGPQEGLRAYVPQLFAYELAKEKVS